MEAKASKLERLGGDEERPNEGADDDRPEGVPHLKPEEEDGVDDPDDVLDSEASALPFTFANGELDEAYAMKPLYEHIS